MTARHPTDRPLDAGERELLVALLHSAGPRIAAFVRHAFGNVADADDVVAEVFCRAAANIEAVRQASRPEYYLLSVARNYCRDALRKRTPEAASAAQLESYAHGGVSPVDAVGQSEMQAELQRAVAGLPQAQREMVALRMSAGLTFQEIADLLNIPLATALSRMHTALERLRGVLGVRA